MKFGASTWTRHSPALMSLAENSPFFFVVAKKPSFDGREDERDFRVGDAFARLVGHLARHFARRRATSRPSFFERIAGVHPPCAAPTGVEA